MHNEISPFIYMIKGIIIGLGTLIPGVSGGSAAIAVGVFEDIIEAVGNFFSHVKVSLYKLIPIGFGAFIGIILISYPIKTFSSHCPKLSTLTFCILAVTSTFILLKSKISFEHIHKKLFITFSGVVVCFLISIITENFQIDGYTNNTFDLFVLGFPLALALVLPAISFSYMLLFFNVYDRFVNSISNMDVSFLLPIAMGILIGSFLFSKIFFGLINKYSEETYCFILGFVLFSVIGMIT